MIQRSQFPRPAIKPIFASSAFLLAPLSSSSGINERARIAITGLKMVTAIHMLRSVFGKTPSACSSTKFAELSNPEIPRRAAANPKKIATKGLKPEGVARLVSRVEMPSKNTKITPTKTSRVKLAR